MQDTFLIIASRFNEMITESLVNGAKRSLAEAGLKPDQTKEIWVPGAFELPVAAARAARSGRFAGIICLGAVIRGDTPHFDYVAGPCASGLMNLGIETGIPIIFGVLTTDTVEQALNRAGLKSGNKGAEAAHTALTMVQTLKQIDAWSSS
jgi:6,7-dimethyl-8-ribityllumazine synthase